MNTTTKSFNHKEYAWIDVHAVLFGREATGLRGVDYKKSQKTEVLHATGKYARGVQLGEITVEGNIILLQSEYRALNAAAKAKGYDSILGCPFDLTVSYIAEGSIDSETDNIVQAYITETPKGIKQGDMYQEITLPFVACDVQEDV